MKFDLLTEPWIRVRMRDGTIREVSIRESFTSARDIAKVEFDNPLAVASVNRLLLAILYRASGRPSKKDWESRFQQESFGSRVDEYLSRPDVADAFDLFSEDKPFFQTPGLVKDKTTSVKKLSPHYATANNKTLFFHANDSQGFAMTVAEAAVALLVCQYFSLGGGVSGTTNLGKHSNFTNAPLIGGAFVWAQGQNLFESLMFNYHDPSGFESEAAELDLAVWERESPVKFTSQRAAQGIADYLTWPSRHIRLLPKDDGRVSEMYFAQGYATPANILREPFFAYKEKKDGTPTPIRLNFERSFWRDSSALLQGCLQDKDAKSSINYKAVGIGQLEKRGRTIRRCLGRDYVASCEVIALDNDKANPKGWYHESMPIFLSYLMHEQSDEDTDYLRCLADTIRYAELKYFGLNAALRQFASALLVEGAKAEDVTRWVEASGGAGYYWPELDKHFPALYRNILKEPEESKKSWQQRARRAARNAFDKAVAAYIGCGEKSYIAYAKGKYKLETELIGHRAFEWKDNMKQDGMENDFIGHLLKLAAPGYENRGALAYLRRTLSDEQDAWLGAFQYLTGQLPPLQYELAKNKSRRVVEWERRCYALVAGLFASHPMHQRNGFSLGRACARLKPEHSDKQTSIDLRFKTLLECEDEQLVPLLRSMFQMLKGKDIPVDYARLLTDLLHWQHPDRKNRLNWATDFWAVHKEYTKTTTEEQGE